MSADILIHLVFGLDDAFVASEVSEMSATYVGDHAVVGLADVCQLVDVAWVTGAHFHDGHLGVRLDSQHSERHSELVVEVALCEDDIVFLG